MAVSTREGQCWIDRSNTDSSHRCNNNEEGEDGRGEIQREPLLVLSAVVTTDDDNNIGLSDIEADTQSGDYPEKHSQPSNPSSFWRFRMLFLALVCCTAGAFLLIYFIDDTDSNGTDPSSSTSNDGASPPLEAIKHGITALKGAFQETGKKANSDGNLSKLFPALLDFYRRGDSSKTQAPNDDANRLDLPPLPGPDNQCSCQGIRNNDTKCCTRYVHVMHKMGYAMTKSSNMPELEPYFSNGSVIRSVHRTNLLNFSSIQDYRDIFLFRNIYDALISGYIYHKSGRECWLTGNGKARHSDKFLPHWPLELSYNPKPPISGRSLCRYLADEPPLVGMHMYMDYVFRHWYSNHLARWAVSLLYHPDGSKRAHIVCFEDVLSSRETALRGTIDFLFHLKGEEIPSSSGHTSSNSTFFSSYEGGHTTAKSHDPVLHDELIGVIQQIDGAYYNGDIAWLNQTWPC